LRGFVVPVSVVIVTVTVVEPAAGGTVTTQAVGEGQAIAVTWPPKSALIWPEGLRKLAPEMTTL
jgi:hypothetical protein